jgi:hypothetical protein
MDIYHDSLHNLVKPILVHTPKDEEKKKKIISQLRKAAKQERVWASSADLEGRSERTRGLKLPKGDPLRMELIADSKIAYDFGKIRIDRANKLTELADNLKKHVKKDK